MTLSPNNEARVAEVTASMDAGKRRLVLRYVRSWGGGVAMTLAMQWLEQEGFLRRTIGGAEPTPLGLAVRSHLERHPNVP